MIKFSGVINNLFFGIFIFIFCMGFNVYSLGSFPWYSVPNKSLINEEYTLSYMNSRPPRLVKELIEPWTFLYYPNPIEQEAYLSSDYNDKKWDLVRLPHTWLTFETTKDIHPFIKSASENDDSYWWKGWGYYRKQLKIDSSLKGKKIFLEFDGVQKYCSVYINGKIAGTHKGGYNSFSVDITNFIDWGISVQQVAVAVNGYRRDKWGIPPMTAGNWNTYSGIYRSVRLVVKNPVFIPYQGNYYEEGGTFITTPLIKSDTAIVNVRTYVKNSETSLVKVHLKTEIINARGESITILTDDKEIAPDSLALFEQQTDYLYGIKQWSPESPELYKVISSVYIENSLFDKYESVLGFRSFKWDYEKNVLYVNGKEINIKGTNRHQEYPWLGDAIPKWITLYDMWDIRYGLGNNFMRTSHYPQDPIVYDFNNQHGIITIEEVPNIKNITFNDDVQEANLRAMIRRDRNNPCVFFWSVGNETSDAADSKWVVEEDTTRIIHARKAKGAGDFVQHTHLNLDLENLLRVTQRGWYDSEDVMSGVEPNPRNGQIAGTNSWQYHMARTLGGSIRGDLTRNCVAWLYQDHGADRKYKGAQLNYVNAKGWVDLYRIPKYLYYLTRANYIDSPMVYIQPHNFRREYSGHKKDFWIDSNGDEVELIQNGNLLGRLRTDQEKYFAVQFKNVLIKPGYLEAISYREGEKVATDKILLPEDPYKLVLKSTHSSFNVQNEGIIVVTATIVDKNGTEIFNANNNIFWDVSGPASLVGPSAYYTDIAKNQASEGYGYDVVPVSNVIRASNKNGKVTVRVSSPGLLQASVTLNNQITKFVDNSLIVEIKYNNENRLSTKRDINYKEERIFTSVLKARLAENTMFKTKDLQLLSDSLINFVNDLEGKDIKFEYGHDIFIQQLVEAVIRTDELIGDDYNFIVDQYNLFLNISQTIEMKMFHEQYSTYLKDYYLQKILINKKSIDYSSVCNYIDSLDPKVRVFNVTSVEEGTDSEMDNQQQESDNNIVTYDYVTRTYNLIVERSNYIGSLRKGLSINGDIESLLKEMVKHDPLLEFTIRDEKYKFNYSPHVLFIP